MCRGWRVREVIAYLTMPARYDRETLGEASRELDFDFTRLSNQIAKRDAELPATELIKNLRCVELKSWLSDAGQIGALAHVVVHGFDVTVPLGMPRTARNSGVRAVLDGLAAGVEYLGVSVTDRRLEATDVDWRYGVGLLLRGCADDLLFAL